MKIATLKWAMFGAIAAGLVTATLGGPAQAQEKKPNIVMLMTDDTGWNN
jgi:hypothetical protein